MKDDILELLKDGKAFEFLEISKELGLSKSDDEKLMKTLIEMTKNYELCMTNRGKYMLLEKNDKYQNYVKGKFMDTDKDYGFVRVPGLDDDIFIHGSKTNGALDGDQVLVLINKQKKDGKSREGEILKVISREVQNKVGEVYHFEKKLMVSLDDKKFKKPIIITGDREQISRLVDGDKIVVSFANCKKFDEYIYADFVKRIGHKNDPDIDILSIIADYEFNIDFPKAVLDELLKVPTEVSNKDMEGRRDLRDKVIFTIDGDDTKDIDDAISIKKLDNGNYELGVHIADVSYYVKENSAIDLEARNRGTSVYLTDRVIPMYPHQLSNGICSLNPDVDRLAISCMMEINSNGKLISYDVFPSVIHSRKQMTYKKVNEILEDGNIPDGYEEFKDDLILMEELALIIRDERNRRGNIDFDTDEAKILVDKDGAPIDIVLRDRGKGEKLIEDFMIKANETIASHFYYMDLPSLYRIHGLPDEDRLVKFLNILSNLGISMRADISKMKPKVIQTIVNELKKHEEFCVLSTKLLSCMEKAIYSPENIGHFALASKMYTHFTSPIRRYPDTMIHRMLRNYFFKQNGINDENVRHFKEILSDIALHSSERERASADCERDVEDMKMAEYMENHIGEEFIGRISGVMSFGFFVVLDNLVEGLVPLDSLPGLYEYDKDREILVGPDGVFKLGQKVKVEVSRASKDEKEIDFRFIERVDVSEKEKVKRKC